MKQNALPASPQLLNRCRPNSSMYVHIYKLIFKINSVLDTAQFQHVFNKFTHSQLSQTKIMEMLEVFKKMCQKIQYRKVIDADNNYNNSQFAQNG